MPGRLFSSRPQRLLLAAAILVLVLLAAGGLYLIGPGGETTSEGENAGERPEASAASITGGSPTALPTKLLFQDDFSDPTKALFPLDSGTTRLRVLYERRPDNGEYLVRLISAPANTGLYSLGPTLPEQKAFAVDFDARAEGKIGGLAYGIAFNDDAVGGLRMQLIPRQRRYNILSFGGGRTTTIARNDSPMPHTNLMRGGACV